MDQHLARILKFCVKKEKLERFLKKSENLKRDYEFIDELLHDNRNIKEILLHRLPLDRGWPIIDKCSWFKDNELVYYIGHGEENRSTIKYTDNLMEMVANDEDFMLFSTERFFGFYKNHENENYIIKYNHL
jgi:hypothetical protein